MLLLQTLERLEAAGINSGELRLPQASAALPNSRSQILDGVVAGVTGAVIGFVGAMVGGALGSAWNHELLCALTVSLTIIVMGCLQARHEYNRGDREMAEFLFATLQAITVTSLGTSLGLACESLFLMQFAFAAGLMIPSLIVRLPGVKSS